MCPHSRRRTRPRACPQRSRPRAHAHTRAQGARSLLPAAEPNDNNITGRQECTTCCRVIIIILQGARSLLPAAERVREARLGLSAVGLHSYGLYGYGLHGYGPYSVRSSTRTFGGSGEPGLMMRRGNRCAAAVACVGAHVSVRMTIHLWPIQL